MTCVSVNGSRSQAFYVNGSASGSAVSCDEGAGGFYLVNPCFNLDTSTLEVIQHRLVVNQFAKDGDGRMLSGGFGEGNGVADAKAHAEVIGADDIDGMLSDHWRSSATLLNRLVSGNISKLLCIVKLPTVAVKGMDVAVQFLNRTPASAV